MTWPSNLVLVRHGESKANKLSFDEFQKLGIAQHESPLTELGKIQATLTGKYLRDRYGDFNDFDVYYTSYYRRAKDTMCIMYPDAKIYEDPRLAEAQHGMWNFMHRDEIAKKYPEEVLRKEREGFYHYRPWGGENEPDVELRIHSFLGTLHRDCGGKNVLLVVHGHWLILLERLLQHFSIEESLRRRREEVAANASVTVYESDDGERMHFAKYCVPWEGK